MFWVTITQIVTKHIAISETFRDSLEITAPSNSIYFSPDGSSLNKNVAKRKLSKQLFTYFRLRWTRSLLYLIFYNKNSHLLQSPVCLMEFLSLYNHTMLNTTTTGQKPDEPNRTFPQKNCIQINMPQM